MNCYYIGMDDVIANAFIESMKQNGNRFLTYEQIYDYGDKAVGLVRKDAEVLFDKSNTDSVLTDYADFFSEQTIDGTLDIEFKARKVQIRFDQPVPRISATRCIARVRVCFYLC